MKHAGIWVVVSVAFGVLQAWDSGAWAVGLTVASRTAAAIALPAASIAATVPHGYRIGALAIGAILLIVARTVSPVSLNTLHLSLFPAAIAILFVASRTAALQEARGTEH